MARFRITERFPDGQIVVAHEDARYLITLHCPDPRFKEQYETDFLDDMNAEADLKDKISRWIAQLRGAQNNIGAFLADEVQRRFM